MPNQAVLRSAEDLSTAIAELKQENMALRIRIQELESHISSTATDKPDM